MTSLHSKKEIIQGEDLRKMLFEAAAASVAET